MGEWACIINFKKEIIDDFSNTFPVSELNRISLELWYETDGINAAVGGMWLSVLEDAVDAASWVNELCKFMSFFIVWLANDLFLSLKSITGAIFVAGLSRLK